MAWVEGINISLPAKAKGDAVCIPLYPLRPVGLHILQNKLCQNLIEVVVLELVHKVILCQNDGQ